MSNIKNWKLSSGSTVLAQVLSFVPGIEQSKIVSKALDGTVHIQTIGAGTKYANISIFSSREEMDLVNKAEADGAFVSAVYREKKYSGYIQSAPSWEAVSRGEWYTATIKLLIITEAPYENNQ